MSIYKKFRRYENLSLEPNVLGSRFDEPSYLSFKLVFAENNDTYYNSTGTQYSNNDSVNYDRMPHPLFSNEYIGDIMDSNWYSSISYLKNSNEFTRSLMLKEFIKKWNTLQQSFQWYFQKVEGVDELLKVNHKRGIRISKENKLTITALEGIDLRMSHLLNLYRKIAWDDTYQRWVLPDMMRYFTLNIYVSEFRTFHGASSEEGSSYNPIAINNTKNLWLNTIDNILPTWLIKCEMCEFDIEEFEFDYLQNLDVGNDPNQAGVKFKIKVGKIYEEQIYPLFSNAYLIDKKLNGFDRSKQEVANFEYDSTSKDTEKNSGDTAKYTDYSSIAQSIKNTPGEEMSHKSGTPFNEQSNKDTIQTSRPTEQKRSAETVEETWFGNAINTGKAYAVGKIEGWIDEGKTKSIPGLGISLTEVEAALESKNIITALGLIRKGIAQVIRDSVSPSEKLEGDIMIDDVFRAYLKGLSEALDSTDADRENSISLRNAVITALNDDGTWGRIKDYSRATDLVGTHKNPPSEINSPNTIEGGSNLTDAIQESTQGDLSKATNLTGEGETNVPVSFATDTKFFEGIPSSQATNNKLD